MMAHPCPQRVHMRADGCNHPYTVGSVSTPYGCESKEMNIRSDWVFCLWGAWLWSVMNQIGHSTCVRPNRHAGPMLCDKYRSRGASMPTCPCHDTDGTPFEGMENTENTSQGAARLRTQDEHEAVTVTPIRTLREVERITPPHKALWPGKTNRRRVGIGARPTHSREEHHCEDVGTFTVRNAHEGHVG